MNDECTIQITNHPNYTTICKASNTTSPSSELNDTAGGNDTENANTGLWVVVVLAIILLCAAQAGLAFFHYRNKEKFQIPVDDNDKGTLYMIYCI